MDYDLDQEIRDVVQGYPTYNKNIKLKVKNDPLSAYDMYSGKPIYKFSYLPKNNSVLFSYPGDYHSDAIGKAGKTKHFDDYVRIIYDPSSNVAGSRPWGLDDLSPNGEEQGVRSYNAQYQAYQFFKKNHPGLKWKFNVVNADLNRGTEKLEAKKQDPKTILNEAQVEKLMKKVLDKKQK